MAPVAAGSNRFAIDLYHQLRTDQDNLSFSPFSIFSALSMRRERKPPRRRP
jgi:serine protease inhibitor